ncbi:hypothetical protein ACCO45_000542 [Purpureocillium lilacinum]|uniref:Uncharacterized protein n=1 Tax=Purpureocillium lilacinum TaxID=33203 RepID=A0ACC4E5C8_PURLI
MATATGFTVAEGLPASLSLSPSEFLAARPHIHRLMAACMVFRRGGGEDREQHGEIPGGSVSTARDASVLHAAARELREETGLRVARFHCPLGMVPAPLPANPPPATAGVAAAASSSLGHEDEAGNGNGIGCEDGNGNGDERLSSPPGLGIAPEEEHARQEPHDEALTVTFWETGRRWGKVSLLVDVREDVARIPSRGRIPDRDVAPAAAAAAAAAATPAPAVANEEAGPSPPTIVMDPREHEEWAWLTEEEVRRGADARGRRMEYTSEGGVEGDTGWGRWAEAESEADEQKQEKKPGWTNNGKILEHKRRGGNKRQMDEPVW